MSDIPPCRYCEMPYNMILGTMFHYDAFALGGWRANCRIQGGFCNYFVYCWGPSQHRLGDRELWALDHRGKWNPNGAGQWWYTRQEALAVLMVVDAPPGIGDKDGTDYAPGIPACCEPQEVS